MESVTTAKFPQRHILLFRWSCPAFLLHIFTFESNLEGSPSILYPELVKLLTVAWWLVFRVKSSTEGLLRLFSDNNQQML